jgi:hypothetical protein
LLAILKIALSGSVVGSKRKAVAVQSVSSTGRTEQVFNVVLGDSVIFIANGFLVRSKPPAPSRDEPANLDEK